MTRRRIVPLLVMVAVLVVGTLVARRRGYAFGRNTLVRCRAGHLFTTIWIPGVSLKSLRLGWWRFQWCPVGRHWTLVAPTKTTEVSDEDFELALARHDLRIP